MKKPSTQLKLLLAGAIIAIFSIIVFSNCGSGLCTGGSEASALGIGGSCQTTDDCTMCYDDDDVSCLTNFRGGYCGAVNCTGDADCPDSSICVKHTDNVNYCFLICTDKEECNVYRDADNEANCASNIIRVSGSSHKACVPPEGSSK